MYMFSHAVRLIFLVGFVKAEAVSMCFTSFLVQIPRRRETPGTEIHDHDPGREKKKNPPPEHRLGRIPRSSSQPRSWLPSSIRGEEGSRSGKKLAVEPGSRAD